MRDRAAPFPGASSASRKSPTSVKNVENQHRKNQEIEQADRKCPKGTRPKPRCLNDQRHAGSVVAVHLAARSKEKPILRHRVINARAGKNQAVVAAESGDQDGERHQDRAGGAEDYLQHCGGNAAVRREFDSARERGRSVGIARDRQHAQDRRCLPACRAKPRFPCRRPARAADCGRDFSLPPR